MNIYNAETTREKILKQQRGESLKELKPRKQRQSLIHFTPEERREYQRAAQKRHRANRTQAQIEKERRYQHEYYKRMSREKKDERAAYEKARRQKIKHQQQQEI